MLVNNKHLAIEARRLIYAGITSVSGAVTSDAVERAILTQHPEITGSDSHFYVWCTRVHVKGVVRRSLKRQSGIADDLSQLNLPGFAYLQHRFIRNGEVTLVRLDKCTRGELQSRIDPYLQQAEGSREHTKELREYLDSHQVPDCGCEALPPSEDEDGDLL